MLNNATERNAEEIESAKKVFRLATQMIPVTTPKLRRQREISWELRFIFLRT
jgi:hypothetical protein